MGNHENTNHPLPAHVELDMPPMKLRPGFEIAAARNIVQSDLRYIGGMAVQRNLTSSWVEGLTYQEGHSAANIVTEGLKANRIISQRDALSYALGATPSMYFSDIPFFIKEEVDKGIVNMKQTTRSMAEVKNAYEIIRQRIQNNLDLQITIETLRLFSIALQRQVGEDFLKLSILFNTEDRLGKLEALRYVLGEENVIGDAVEKTK